MVPVSLVLSSVYFTMSCSVVLLLQRGEVGNRDNLKHNGRGEKQTAAYLFTGPPPAEYQIMRLTCLFFSRQCPTNRHGLSLLCIRQTPMDRSQIIKWQTSGERIKAPIRAAMISTY